MNNIKKGDEVVVLTGKDKGKRGAVLSVLQEKQKVIVENINMAKKLIQILKYIPINVKKVKIKYVKDRPGHDFRYALNSNKIHKELNWKPQISLNRGLKDTFNWYLRNINFFTSVSKKFYDKRLGLKK